MDNIIDDDEDIVIITKEEYDALTPSREERLEYFKSGAHKGAMVRILKGEGTLTDHKMCATAFINAMAQLKQYKLMEQQAALFVEMISEVTDEAKGTRRDN